MDIAAMVLMLVLVIPLQEAATTAVGGGGLDTLITLLLPVVAVVAGRYLYEGIQVVGVFVDAKLPAAVHAVALVVVQFALIQLAQMLGLPLPEALSGFTPEISTALATAAMGMGWHALAKKKEEALLAASTRVRVGSGGVGTPNTGGGDDRIAG